MPRPIGVDLFAGAGGMSLGFEQAGFDVVAAVEIDPIHAAVHAYNFPQCVVLANSVKDLSGEDIRLRAKIGMRKVDVVFGGAPCQGFSLIGQRALDDPRNALVRDYVRIVRELDADHFVFENVKGITYGKHVQFLEELVQTFAANGYQVQMPWKVLNAVAYGVPQDRERLFLMGSKIGLGVPSYPKPTHRKAGTLGELPEGPSCSDALADLPDAEAFKELLSGDSVSADCYVPTQYARELRGIVRGPGDFSHPRKWDRQQLTGSARTDHSDISRRRFAATAPGAVEPISRFFKLAASGVSNTLRAGTDSSRGAFTSPRPIHYLYPRCVTVREMARLHGFPDWFRFHVTKWHGARQIGNAVPPPLARAVAAEVARAAGLAPTRPNRAVHLGARTLLTLDMGQAAEHFAVPVPISGRTTKAAPKRRQWDDARSMAAE